MNQMDFRGAAGGPLMILGIFMLVGFWPVGLLLLFIGGVMLGGKMTRAKATYADQEARDYEKWNRERIIAAKSLGR